MFIGVLHPVESPSEEYPFALAAGLWFHYESLRLLVIELKFEVFRVLRENPSRGEEIVVIRAFSLHGLQIASEQVFSCKGMHTCEVIHSLVRLHLKKELRINGGIEPVNIPVGIVSF